MGSLDEALDACEGEAEVFVIGGASLFAEALPRADRLYLTRVLATMEGDTFFPEDELENYFLVSEERHPIDEKHRLPYSFQLYERRES